METDLPRNVSSVGLPSLPLGVQKARQQRANELGGATHLKDDDVELTVNHRAAGDDLHVELDHGVVGDEAGDAVALVSDAATSMR